MKRTPRLYKCLTIITILVALAFFSSLHNNVTNAYESDNQSTPQNFSQKSFGNVSLIEHKITSAELSTLKSKVGVYQQGKNYNQIIDGYGTGFQPPTTDQWNTMPESAYLVDNVSYPNAPSSFDNSKSQYFPPIGNQGSQGSCVAWSVGYYITTFQAAKDHGWNLTGAKWSGGQPTLSYQNKIISPAFTYNLINYGQDGGSSFSNAVQLTCFMGDCSWINMPYNQNDYTSWPSEAAWTEAPLYRGNSSGYQYLSLTDSTGISNLKNLLASGNLATIGVDASKFPNLSSNDVWTLDNYNSPSINHAGTVVGYDDNFNYTESGQVRFGAFKIANSWGISNWEPVQTGFYWISYAAMEQRVGISYYYFDQSNYQPNLLATFNINDSARSNCIITVGLGNSNKPITTKCFSNYVFGGNKPFCSNNIVMDISEFQGYVPNLYNQSFFLEVYDNQGYQTNGTIMYFAIGNWSASGIPCQTVKNQNVFLNVTYNPYISSNITLLPAGGSVPVLAPDYFQIPYYLNGQPQVAQAQNGTITLTADGGTIITILGLSNSSNGTEEWALNSQNASATIPAGSNATFYYYDLLSQQAAYAILGDGNPISPIFIYYTAPSTASSQFNQTEKATFLPNSSPQTFMLLRGINASVSNNILNITTGQTPQAQWATSISTWNISQSNQIPNPIMYYYQYQVNATYATSDSSIAPYSPILSGTQFGANYQLSLSVTNQTIWLDANTSWSINNTLAAPTGTEQWICSTSTSGDITGATEIEPIYLHQLYLTVTSPFGSPTGEGWYNSGSTANFGVTTPYSGGTGTQYILNVWSGSGIGSYDGSATSYSVTMNNPITEVSNWKTQYYLTVNNDGHGATAGSGWYNSGSSTQAIILSNVVSGDMGTQFAFSGWTGDTSGSGSTSNTIIMDSPKAATATWITQYLVTFIVTPSGSGSTNPTGNLWVDSGPLSISIKPDSGYSFSQWTADGGSITFSNFNSISTTVNVNGPGTITATLTLNPIPTPTPSPTPTTTPTPSPQSTTTPTPSHAASATTVPAKTDSGTTVDLTVDGNVTCSQMTNVKIAANTSASTTTISFTITGESGTTGFGNITIPINAVPYGTKPTIYIDNQPAQNQGYCQDSSNYHVWYTTKFSTHEITIVFSQSSSVPEFPSETPGLLLIILLLIAGLSLYFKKYSKST